MEMKSNDLIATNISINNSNKPLLHNSDRNDTKDNETIIFIDNIYGKPKSIEKPKKLGRVLTFLYYKGEPLLTIGPHCNYSFKFILDKFLITLLLFINSIQFLLSYFLYPNISLPLIVIGYSCYILLNGSLLFTALINPGIPPIKKVLNIYEKFNDQTTKIDSKLFQICKDCNIIVFKKFGVYHCEECNLCCEGINMFRKKWIIIAGGLVNV